MWLRIPAITNQADSRELCTNWFNPFEYPHHRPPPEFAVPDIQHVELAALRVQRMFPQRVVCIEQKGDYVGPEWVQCWLTYLVCEAVAHLNPTSRCRCVKV